MALQTVTTPVTGTPISSSEFGIPVANSVNELNVFDDAGQLIQSASATTCEKIAAPSVGELLGYVAGKWGPVSLGISFDYFVNATSYEYGTATWRDVPNSSKVVTLTKTSTILCIGGIYEYGKSGSTYAFMEMKFSIDGTEMDNFITQRHYGIFEPITLPIFGYKENVAAGDITIKLREYSNTGTYVVARKFYMVIIIPS
jgi:hypothetical protein